MALCHKSLEEFGFVSGVAFLKLMVSSVSALRTYGTGEGWNLPVRFDLLVVALGEIHRLVDAHASGLGDVGGDFAEEILFRLVFRLGLFHFRFLKAEDRLATIAMFTSDGNIAFGNLIPNKRLSFETACLQAIAPDFSNFIIDLGSAPSGVLSRNGFLQELGITKVEDELASDDIALGGDNLPCGGFRQDADRVGVFEDESGVVVFDWDNS